MAVLAAASGARIAAGEEAGAGRGTDGGLAECVFEEDAGAGEGVEVGGVDEGVAVAAEGVVALLVGADPEEVGAFGHDGPFNP